MSQIQWGLTHTLRRMHCEGIRRVLEKCNVPVTVIWGTLLQGRRSAEKAVNKLQYGKLIMLEGNSYSRSFDDEYARQAAEETVKAIRNWKYCEDCNAYYLDE